MSTTTCFYGELTKIILQLSPNTLLICSTIKETCLQFLLHNITFICVRVQLDQSLKNTDIDGSMYPMAHVQTK